MTVDELRNQLQEAIKEALDAKTVTIAPMQSHIKIKMTYKVGGMKYCPRSIEKIKSSAIATIQHLTQLKFDGRIDVTPHSCYKMYLAELSSEKISRDRARKITKLLKYFAVKREVFIRAWCESILITAKPLDKEAFRKFLATP